MREIHANLAPYWLGGLIEAASVDGGPTDEQLVVATQSDAVGVSLYLDPALLERLRHADPILALHQGNVADYWTALEGVSHFVYFAWNAAHDKPVSLLELEMQAEIDKYVASYALLRRQSPQRFPADAASQTAAALRSIPNPVRSSHKMVRRSLPRHPRCIPPAKSKSSPRLTRNKP